MTNSKYIVKASHLRSPSETTTKVQNKISKDHRNKIYNLNMSTDNLGSHIDYTRFLDHNMESKAEKSNRQLPLGWRNNAQIKSSSLGVSPYNARGFMSSKDIADGTSPIITTDYSTIAKKSKNIEGKSSIGLGLGMKSSKLPSIFETYLKMNPISPSTLNSDRTKKVIPLEQHSSILDLSKDQQQRLLEPLQDSALQEAKKKFLATTLRKQITSKTSFGMVNQQSKNLIENSIIAESSESPMGQTETGFRPSNQGDTTKSMFQSKDTRTLPQTSQRWNLLQNLDFLDDDEDAQNFDLQIPKYDPVCFCTKKEGEKKQNQCLIHDSIDGMIELIGKQFEQVQELNINVEEEIDYLDTSIKKIVFLRGHTFYDSVMGVIRSKNQEISELKSEVSRLLILRKDNEILAMKIAQMEDDQDYMRDKVSESKQQKSIIDKLEELVKDLKIQLDSRENQMIDLKDHIVKVQKELKQNQRQIQEEKNRSLDLIERIKALEFQVKKVNAENLNLKQFLNGEVQKLSIDDQSVIEKAKKLLSADYKLQNTNLLSTNLEHLEEEVKNLNTIRYLAIASVDIKKGRDLIEQNESPNNKSPKSPQKKLM